jgi:hypothetical protein
MKQQHNIFHAWVGRIWTRHHVEHMFLHPVGCAGHVFLHPVGSSGCQMSTHYFSCSVGTGSDSIKSSMGHIMANMCFCILWDLRVT